MQLSCYPNEEVGESFRKLAAARKRSISAELLVAVEAHLKAGTAELSRIKSQERAVERSSKGARNGRK